MVPICNEKNSNGFKVVALKSKDSSKIIQYSRNASFYPELIPAAGKLDCYLTSCAEFKYSYHFELNSYIHDHTPTSLLTIASEINYTNITLTQDETKALRYFIFQHPVIPVNLSQAQKSVTLNLLMFPAMQNNKLNSLQGAKSTVAGKSATMLVLDPERLNMYRFCIPQFPLILTSDRASIENLKPTLPESCWFPTKLQIIVL